MQIASFQEKNALRITARMSAMSKNLRKPDGIFMSICGFYCETT